MLQDTVDIRIFHRGLSRSSNPVHHRPISFVHDRLENLPDIISIDSQLYSANAQPRIVRNAVDCIELIRDRSKGSG